MWHRSQGFEMLIAPADDPRAYPHFGSTYQVSHQGFRNFEYVRPKGDAQIWVWWSLGVSPEGELGGFEGNIVGRGQRGTVEARHAPSNEAHLDVPDALRGLSTGIRGVRRGGVQRDRWWEEVRPFPRQEFRDSPFHLLADKSTLVYPTGLLGAPAGRLAIGFGAGEEQTREENPEPSA
jgi:hypothetical protein